MSQSTPDIPDRDREISPVPQAASHAEPLGTDPPPEMPLAQQPPMPRTGTYEAVLHIGMEIGAGQTLQIIKALSDLLGVNRVRVDRDDLVIRYDASTTTLGAVVRALQAIGLKVRAVAQLPAR